MYSVHIERGAAKSLAKISEPHQSRVAEALCDLADNPRPTGCCKLHNRDGWRIRVGDFRVIYEIRDNILLVLVVEIGHRREIYR